MKKNRIPTFLLILSLIFLTTCSQNNSPKNGLVSHFTFNGEKGDLIQSDIIIKKNDAASDENRIGTKGNSLRFDGLKSYAEIPQNPAFEFDDNNFSISIWIKHPSQLKTEGLPQFVFIKSLSTVAPVEGMALIADYPKRGVVSFRIDSEELLTSKSSYLDNNQWQHFVCVKDGDMLYMYLNGKLDNSLKIKKLPKVSNSAPLTFGANHINHKDNYEGLIDDFRIYNRPLSQEEVANLYNYELKTAIE